MASFILILPLCASIISIITIIFAGYALIFNFYQFILRRPNVKNMLTHCMYFLGWKLTLHLVFFLSACGLFFLGKIILEILNISFEGAWLVSTFLLTSFLSAWLTAILWKFKKI